jgi:hypothetical protein
MNHINLETANGADLNRLQQILGKCKRVVCVTGAGISCSAGIPDFRSQQIAIGKGKKKDESQGLYFQQFGNLKGRELFDASILKREDTTLTFMSFMTALKSTSLWPSWTLLESFCLVTRKTLIHWSTRRRSQPKKSSSSMVIWIP